MAALLPLYCGSYFTLIVDYATACSSYCHWKHSLTISHHYHNYATLAGLLVQLQCSRQHIPASVRHYASTQCMLKHSTYSFTTHLCTYTHTHTHTRMLQPCFASYGRSRVVMELCAIVSTQVSWEHSHSITLIVLPSRVQREMQELTLTTLS